MALTERGTVPCQPLLLFEAEWLWVAASLLVDLTAELCTDLYLALDVTAASRLLALGWLCQICKLSDNVNITRRCDDVASPLGFWRHLELKIQSKATMSCASSQAKSQVQ